MREMDDSYVSRNLMRKVLAIFDDDEVFESVSRGLRVPMFGLISMLGGFGIRMVWIGVLVHGCVVRVISRMI